MAEPATRRRGFMRIGFCPRPRAMDVADLALTPLPDIVPDVLAPGLDLVICGTAPGTISAARQAYYANPGNRFWRILAETGLTPRLLRPEQYPEMLAIGIGLTDVCKTAFGQDDTLPATGFDRARLAASLRRYRPGVLAFNSKRAASAFLGVPTGRLAYGRQEDLPEAELPAIFVLPSTSGLACRAWHAAPWHELAGHVARLRAMRSAKLITGSSRSTAL
jgi:double-stranded uracil-DNA glycosylase